MAATVLLLHAMGSSHRMWRAQVAALSGRYDLVVPDLPGHGDTPGPFTIDAAVARACELLGERPEPVHLVGASLGANIALALARQQPARVASLLLSGAALRVPRVGVAIQRAVTAILPLRVTSAMSARVVRAADDRDRQALVEDIRRAGKRTQAAGLRELTGRDPESWVPATDAPMLVCCGDDDRANLPSARLLAERAPGATLRIMPGGHLWNLQHPDLCTEVIDTFVGGRS